MYMYIYIYTGNVLQYWSYNRIHDFSQLIIPRFAFKGWSPKRWSARARLKWHGFPSWKCDNCRSIHQAKRLIPLFTRQLYRYVTLPYVTLRCVTLYCIMLHCSTYIIFIHTQTHKQIDSSVYVYIYIYHTYARIRHWLVDLFTLFIIVILLHWSIDIIKYYKIL